MVFACGLSFYTNAVQAKFFKESKEIVDEMCGSNEPVLVIDTFPADGESTGNEASGEISISMGLVDVVSDSKGRIMDVDGDGVPDLFHGEFVELLVQTTGFLTERVNIRGARSLPDLAELLEPVILSIEKGEKKYSRINLSQENPLKLSAFKAELYPDDPTFPEINAENVVEYSDKILEHFWTHGKELKVKELYDIFSRFQKAGVPVVVAAGNFGPNYVNLFSLMPGVVSVGSLDPRGNKLLISADNKYVNWWRLGVVAPTEVINGMDLSGDGLSDIGFSRLSGGATIVSDYVGKRALEIKATVDPDLKDWLMREGPKGFLVHNAALNILEPGLYDVEEIVNLGTVTPGTAKYFRSLGRYALKQKDGKPPRIFFDVDESGALVFNPSKDGRAGQKTRISGTSFAAPFICNK